MTIAEQLRAEGKSEGKLEGMAEGEAKGKAAGKVEGRAEGKIEAIKTIAINAFNDGLEFKKIQRLTGLSEEELRVIEKANIH